jgi:hypothetical protein
MRWNTGALCVVALAVGVSVASFVPGVSQSLRNVVGLAPSPGAAQPRETAASDPEHGRHARNPRTMSQEFSG